MQYVCAKLAHVYGRCRTHYDTLVFLLSSNAHAYAACRELGLRWAGREGMAALSEVSLMARLR